MNNCPKHQPEVCRTEFGRCDVCHREFKDTDHRRLAPYIPMPPGHVMLSSAEKSAAKGND
ncbi:MAG: hypothetical protein R3E58_17580 [Phycisphaerae bacterium]